MASLRESNRDSKRGGSGAPRQSDGHPPTGILTFLVLVTHHLCDSCSASSQLEFCPGNLTLLDEQDPMEADILDPWSWEFVESCVFPMVWLPQGPG